MEKIFFSGSNQYVIMAPRTRQHKKKQIENSALLYVKICCLVRLFIFIALMELEICIS